MALAKAPKRRRKLTADHLARSLRVGTMEGSLFRNSDDFELPPVVRAQRTPDGKGISMDEFQVRASRGGHSYFRERPCPACGDLDGCHLWRERPKDEGRKKRG